jgi:NAD(P)-dependent dehydrogenase (short-subunit alcohol dehydrogenase family)
MSKDKVQASYMRELKKEHGWKQAPSASAIHLAISGASRAGSIGQAIKESFRDNIIEFPEDVVDSSFDFHEYTGLIMCHGYTYMDWIEEMPDEETERILAVNLFGSIRMIKQFVNDTLHLPYRKKIIAIGSMAYNKVLNGSAAYCASKAGLNHFIKCAAWELTPKGYDIYIIHPSNVMDAPMSADTIKHLMRYRGLDEKEATAYWAANNPRSSFLTKEEIVQLVEFLIYNDTDYLTGSPIELAGGQR